MICFQFFLKIGNLEFRVKYKNIITEVVRGATWGSTNQKAGFRSRGTNGPISVQQKVM